MCMTHACSMPPPHLAPVSDMGWIVLQQPRRCVKKCLRRHICDLRRGRGGGLSDVWCLERLARGGLFMSRLGSALNAGVAGAGPDLPHCERGVTL